ncbi:hypothetical protein JCM14036_13860 [Desulfotomaculum defluvii]
MNSLLLIIIIWTIISVLSSNKRKQTQLPPQEQETSNYRLPPDLRGKWGPKSEDLEESITHAEKVKEPQIKEPIIVAETPEISAQLERPQAKKLAPKVQMPKDRMEEDEECGFDPLRSGNFTPGMLKNGIILSEILGPPVARRKGRSYQ